jgi:Xaa-Pro aminopeptidase
MNSEIFSQRRDLLANQLSVGEAVVLFAKREAHLEKFTQENNFLYLTGLAVPNAIFVMVKGERSLVSQLFLQRGIPEEEVWTGKKMRPDEATEISGITKISYLDQFLGELSLHAPRIKKLFSNIGNPKLDHPLPYAMFALKPLTERYPGIVLTDIHDLIAPLRKVKSDWELMQLQRAIDITGKGIMDIMECAKAGMMEYELEATLFYRMQISGARTWGFAPIIACGSNAAPLH